MSLRAPLLSLPFVLGTISGCASGKAWLAEPFDGNNGEHERHQWTFESEASPSPLPAVNHHREVIRIGSRDAVEAKESSAPAPVTPQAPTTIVINNNVTTPSWGTAFGYPYAPTRPQPSPPMPPGGSADEDDSSPPSYGPPMLDTTAPGPAWR